MAVQLCALGILLLVITSLSSGKIRAFLVNLIGSRKQNRVQIIRAGTRKSISKFLKLIRKERNIKANGELS